MNTEKITITATFSTAATQLYNDWLSSNGHTEMTGGEANCSTEAGASFTTWNGYIEGRNIILEENHRIIQSWRTMEFNTEAPDSQIEILLEEDNDVVKFTLNHTNIPTGDGEKYKSGWMDHYVKPMSEYYNK